MLSNSLFQLKIAKKKGLTGIALGLLSLLTLYLLRDAYIASESGGLPDGYLVGIPLAMLFTIVGLIRIVPQKPVVAAVLNACWHLAAALGTLFATMAAVETLGIWRMEPVTVLLNVVLFSGFVCVVYGFTGRLKRSVTVVSAAQVLIAGINSFVWQFRGREILFSDLSAIGTAMTVATDYRPAFTLKMAIGLFAWLLVMFSRFSLPADKPKKSPKIRLAAFGAAVLLTLLSVVGCRNMVTRTFSNNGTNYNGFYLNFICSIRDAIIRAPENYSPALIEDLENDYADPGEAPGDYPNIIVIMNESFGDLRVFGDELRTNQPVTPFFDSLRENTIRGYALISAYGGHTANSEFEFLTGLTMGFLPVGSTPYQQYIHEDIFSMPRLLESCGYAAISTHPFHESGWGRKLAYPCLGFQESTFLPDYPQENLIREHVSDQEMYAYVLKKLDEGSGDQPRFIFGITMQNHGGYTYEGDNYTKHIELEGYAREYPMAEQYLSLLYESDRALEYLLTSLEDYEEDTLVVFFGDHFPSVEEMLYGEIHGKPLETLDETLLQYTVPFVIWANYDIEEKTVERTTLGNLGGYLLDAAGIQRPAFYQFLAELEQHIPAINQLGYFSVSNQCFLPRQEAQGEEKAWLDKYEALQYNALFDPENRSDLFFDQYVTRSP